MDAEEEGTPVDAAESDQSDNAVFHEGKVRRTKPSGVMTGGGIACTCSLLNILHVTLCMLCIFTFSPFS